ncbi:hypothetical protein RJ639_046437 [Escallonia herrerae]|uniref:Pentatricopeptide repeat-containing protein n=1 Tax=Escallonia herrerae TaxID=1293975 RepID=A0AA88WAG0_9ASTE|nr:hypothetical protein RJ639_046437 [Escallonia herrerae]
MNQRELDTVEKVLIINGPEENQHYCCGAAYRLDKHHQMHLEIAKLVADGLYKQAILFYTQLRNSTSFQPTKFTFPPLLKACAKLKSLDHAQMLHTLVIKTGFQSNTHTATSLTDAYMKLHLLGHALQMFNEIPEPNTTSLNVAITGFAQNGCYKEALGVFRLVGLRGFRPDSVTMASILSACEDVTHGIQLHCWAVKMGVEGDIYAATSLVTMYSNCARLISAAEVFERIRDKNVVCCNAFITGLLRNGIPQLVLDVFKGIRGSMGVEPNSVTLISVLSACSDMKYIQFGRQVHGYVVKFEMDIDTMVGTALVDMYSKCRSWKWAYDVFGGLVVGRNLITWNSMIAGMMLNGQSENAIELFAQLDSEGLKPDSATWNSMISGFSQLGKEVEAFMFFRKMLSADVTPSLKSITSLLPACSAIAGLRYGQEIHGHIIRTDNQIVALDAHNLTKISRQTHSKLHVQIGQSDEQLSEVKSSPNLSAAEEASFPIPLSAATPPATAAPTAATVSPATAAGPAVPSARAARAPAAPAPTPAAVAELADKAAPARPALCNTHRIMAE